MDIIKELESILPLQKDDVDYRKEVEDLEIALCTRASHTVIKTGIKEFSIEDVGSRHRNGCDDYKGRIHQTYRSRHVSYAKTREKGGRYGVKRRG